MRKTHKIGGTNIFLTVSGLYHRFVPLVYDGDDRL